MTHRLFVHELMTTERLVGDIMAIGAFAGSGSGVRGARKSVDLVVLRLLVFGIDVRLDELALVTTLPTGGVVSWPSTRSSGARAAAVGFQQERPGRTAAHHHVVAERCRLVTTHTVSATDQRPNERLADLGLARPMT